MKMMLIAGLLITLPAIVVIVFFFGSSAMLPALASFGVNMLPFLVAAWLIGQRKDAGDEIDAH